MIRVEGLSRRYGATLAVADVSFEVEPGELLALVGDVDPAFFRGLDLRTMPPLLGYNRTRRHWEGYGAFWRRCLDWVVGRS